MWYGERRKDGIEEEGIGKEGWNNVRSKERVRERRGKEEKRKGKSIVEVVKDGKVVGEKKFFSIILILILIIIIIC
jgi:hypothetical protein